jgi:SNF2 family DNA or RNA helicase
MADALRARSYQSTAARFVAEGRSVGIFDWPGLGKTLEAIAGIIEAGVRGPRLVVCPISANTAWAGELASRAPNAPYMMVDGNRATRINKLDTILCYEDPWIIINPEMLRTKTIWRCRVCKSEWRASEKPKSAVVDCGHRVEQIATVHEHSYPRLFAQPYAAIVMDEAHDTLVRLSGTPTLVRAGARLLTLQQNGVKIACTGTPLRGKPHQLFGTLQWLRPKAYGGFWAWAENYFVVVPASRFGGLTVGSLRPEREKLLFQSLNGIIIRRTKEEVSPELPPKQYMGTPLGGDGPTAVWLSLLPKQARAYKEMQKAGTAKVRSGYLDAVGLLAERTRLQQFSTAYGSMTGADRGFLADLPSNKYDWLAQFLRELNILDNDGTPALGKVVVVSRFTSVLRLFARELMKSGVKVLGITGRVKGKDRARAVETFNSKYGDCHVMFLQTKAGGVSVTLDAADDMVILDEYDDPDRQEQAEERINNRRPEERIATRRYWYLKSLGTIDEAIARTNLALDVEQKHMLDGRRGVAYSRAVFTALEEM